MTKIEMQSFFKLFNQGGYVLDFSTADFDDFTYESIGERLCEKYELSKGRSFEKYCIEAPEDKVLQLLSDLVDYYPIYLSTNRKATESPLYARCKEILEKNKEQKNNNRKHSIIKPRVPLTEGSTIQRQKRYIFLKELGHGASGGTYLFLDESSNRKIAIKKSEPITGNIAESYDRFVNEAEILIQLNHPNIVRLYDYDLYPQQKLGYILMEYIEGDPIGTKQPEEFNKTWENWFEDTMRAFAVLESKSIVHRDIRPKNILVDKSGNVKIIDFGFGRIIKNSKDLHNSISLAWITTVKPEELSMLNEYGIDSDIYYLGVLFRQIIPSDKLSSFRYKHVLDRMDVIKTDSRISSFKEILEEIEKSPSPMDMFSNDEIGIYREFSFFLETMLVKWTSKPVFEDDENVIIDKLHSIEKNCCLEFNVPMKQMIVQCFTSTASFKYRRDIDIKVSDFIAFCKLLTESTKEKRALIIRNIRYKLASITIQEKSNSLPF